MKLLALFRAYIAQMEASGTMRYAHIVANELQICKQKRYNNFIIEKQNKEHEIGSLQIYYKLSAYGNIVRYTRDLGIPDSDYGSGVCAHCVNE